ncbi:pentapeptide repeat protein [Stappia aggregata IAM 12614]|uniref:Pentapeptide repeat protein n=2 Tax=Roseibium aggregatum TaxID=187304 RepID=A0P0W9_ROSAI|nr:pentapeptide repeat protein [Stappia aggregata IAM 12614] [Roseibium aggregatum IAM 12614]
MNTVFQKNNSDSKTKDGSRFNHANDSGMTLKDAEFIEKNSEELLAKLKREAAANKFSLRGIDLSGIVFGPESDFSGLDLRGAIFDNCDLTGASFDGANLEGASFKNVVAIGTTFINARMLNANLSDGNFRDSDFTDADLKQTNVWGAAFYEVTFQRTDIRGAYWKDTYETEVMHEDDEIRSLSGECDKQSSPRALSFDEQSWPHAPSFDL